MIQYFYVLFDTERSAFYVDNQFGYTYNVLIAERYDTNVEALSALQYFPKEDKRWRVKKVTVSVEQ